VVAEALPFDIRLDDPLNPKGSIVVGAFLFAGMLALSLLFARAVSGMTLDDLGWRRPAGRLGVAGWVALGLSLAATAVSAILSVVQPTPDPVLGFGFSLTLVFFCALGAFVAPVAEEVVFRGYLFAGFRKVMPMLAAALLTGALFGAVQLAGGEPLPTIAAVGALGACWAVLRDATGSIAPGLVLHGAQNAAVLVGVTGQPGLCVGLFVMVSSVALVACLRPGPGPEA
jgi:membrane protease YdiL (CAAX protease family)